MKAAADLAQEMYRKTPDFKLNLPPMKECDICLGKGTVKGIFYEMVCDTCNGAGVVHAHTGERIEEALLIPAMKRTIEVLKSQRRFLLAHVKQAQEQGYLEENEKETGAAADYGKGRYTGD